MQLEKIISISGKPGLFKLVSQLKNGFIVEDITTKKKASISNSSQVSLLDNIAMFTFDKEVPLFEVFENIAKKYDYKPLIWILDRLVIPVSIGAAFVRIGNFINSEIVGEYTGNNFGVVFQNRREIAPRHPAQLYEAIGYIALFLLLRYLYNNKPNRSNGYLFGVFFAVLFSIRFLVEFVKESQGGFEDIMPMFSTGQWLSIPMILFGLFFMFRKPKTIQI